MAVKKYKLIKNIHLGGVLKKAGDIVELPEATGKIWCDSKIVVIKPETKKAKPKGK